MGVLANHVPTIEPLKPGVIEVIEDSGSQSKKWFGEASPPCSVSASSFPKMAFLTSGRSNADATITATGGFAIMHGNNTLTVNAVEAFPLDKFSAEVSANEMEPQAF